MNNSTQTCLLLYPPILNSLDILAIPSEDEFGRAV